MISSSFIHIGHDRPSQRRAIDQSNMESALHQAEDWAGWQGDEHVLLCMPLFHIAGVNVGLIGLYEGLQSDGVAGGRSG